MITMLTYGVAALYGAGLLTFLGAGVAHEHGARDPNYTDAATISMLWPLVLVLWLYLSLTHDSD